LRRIVEVSIGDYKGRKNSKKKRFIWDLVEAFQNETDPKRRFVERAATDTAWREAPAKKVYNMIQRMLSRKREDDDQGNGTACGQSAGVGSGEESMPPPWPYGAAESNEDDGASLKTELASLRSSRNVRKRRKVPRAGSTARRRRETSECVDSINDNDVMCGGGIRQGADDYRGNAQLFELLERFRTELQPEGADERRIAESVVQHIRHMDPPGRFLKENADGKWYHIGTCWFRCCILIAEICPRKKRNVRLTVLLVLIQVTSRPFSEPSK
jgi:hypothetical protein